MLTFSSSYFCSHFPYIIYFCILKRSRKLKRSFVSLVLAFVACLKWKIFNFLAATKEFAANLGDYEGGGWGCRGKQRLKGMSLLFACFYLSLSPLSLCVFLLTFARSILSQAGTQMLTLDKHETPLKGAKDWLYTHLQLELLILIL